MTNGNFIKIQKKNGDGDESHETEELQELQLKGIQINLTAQKMPEEMVIKDK